MKPAFDLQDSSPPSRIQLNVLGRRRRASCGMDTPCAFNGSVMRFALAPSLQVHGF